MTEVLTANRIPLENYAEVVGAGEIEELRALAKPLRGRSIEMINSTAVGGGVAEILNRLVPLAEDRKSTRLNSSHGYISYAVFCLKKKKKCYLCLKLLASFSSDLILLQRCSVGCQLQAHIFTVIRCSTSALLHCCLPAYTVSDVIQ